LGPFARQEVLRTLLAEFRISSGLPEMRRLKRQTGFFKKLDRAIQSGRMSFAHLEERAVFSERLLQKLGPNPIRDEVELLAGAYEAWLQASGCWDPPLLIRAGIEVLQEGIPSSIRLPESILLFSAQTQESLERDFWDSLGRHVPIQLCSPLPVQGEESPVLKPPSFEWHRWHTLDDAAEDLAERLSLLGDWENHAILIPDQPGIRRSLRRALESYGVPLADTRDPTRLRWDEGLKWALLPLNVVSRRFERAQVVAWLRTHMMQEEFPAWCSEISARGIRQGLAAYSGGMLSGVHSRLNELQESFGSRMSCSDLAEAHLKYLRAAVGTSEHLLWVIPFFEATWKDLEGDLTRVGRNERRAPLLYWMERLQARVNEASPPVEKLKSAQGVQLYRLGQAPLNGVTNLWVFGLPPNWFSGDGCGDYWYSEREREILSTEFAVRSAIQVKRERFAIFRAWLTGAAQVRFLDANYDWDGKERESLVPLFRDVGLIARDQELEAQEYGSHPRWTPSFGALRPLPPQKFALPSLRMWGIREIRATEVDHYSRCAFRGIAAGRWGLWDTREPEGELWPEVRGNILHAAVKILLESRDHQGHFSVLPSDALEQGWRLQRPKGLLKGKRIESYQKSKLLRVLETFCEKEREYVQRAGTTIASLEGPALRMEFPEFAIIGIPDRVDEHPEGIFIQDFKTSSSLPKGKEMVEQGYRLQLPFYALAAQRVLQKKAIGVQFIELNKKGGRTCGVFFKQYNGKEPGNLTNTRARNSLFDQEPGDIWVELEKQLLSHAQDYYHGRVEARPKKEIECRTCAFVDLCGRKRLAADSGEPGND